MIDEHPDVDKLSKAELVEIVREAFEQTTAVHSDRPAANSVHPTAKPVALLTRLMENSSTPGAMVLDPFGGSGSTLIACHGARRTAALAELDPTYADVICRRYQEHTGVKPILEQTGEPHDFTS